MPIDTCCFAVAGSVSNDSMSFRNRDGWIIDRLTIETDFGIKRVQLVNYFVAPGHGVLSLTDDNLNTVQAGKFRPNAPEALVIPGTVLCECYLGYSSESQFPSMFPSDVGHVKFPARSQIEDELSDFLQNRFSKRSNEAESEPNVSQYLEGMITKERARVSVE